MLASSMQTKIDETASHVQKSMFAIVKKGQMVSRNSKSAKSRLRLTPSQ